MVASSIKLSRFNKFSDMTLSCLLAVTWWNNVEEIKTTTIIAQVKIFRLSVVIF